LLCPACGCGLVVAGRVEHGTSSAFAGVQLGRILGLKVVRPEAVFYGALVRDVGCRSCDALLALVVHRPRTGASAGQRLVANGCERHLAARCTGDAGVAGAYAAREE